MSHAFEHTPECKRSIYVRHVIAECDIGGDARYVLDEPLLRHGPSRGASLPYVSKLI
jgi:hypothetical protein